MLVYRNIRKRLVAAPAVKGNPGVAASYSAVLLYM
jgi:hypothetical protein